MCGQSSPVHVENIIQYFVKVSRQDGLTDVLGGFFCDGFLFKWSLWDGNLGMRN